MTIAFANHKGGCSKTTSIANVGCALALLGRRVLAVDCDPQANLSELLGCADGHRPGLEDALTDPATARNVIRDTDITEGKGQQVVSGMLSVIPCSDRLADAIADGVPNGELALRDLLAEIGAGFDAVLIDTPPGLGALSSMALLASDWVIVPARPADFDVAGAVKLADLIAYDLCAFNPDLQLLGVLVCQTNMRWTLDADTTVALQEAGIRRLSVEIPFAVSVGRAPRHGMPTIVTDPDGRVADAYRRLAVDLDRALLS